MCGKGRIPRMPVCGMHCTAVGLLAAGIYGKGGFPQIFRLPCRICLPQYKSNKKYKIAKKNVPKK